MLKKISLLLLITPLIITPLIFLSDVNKVSSNECDVTVSPGQSIQQGINQAGAGQTVCVEYATYVEVVNINKPITLKGINNPQGLKPIIDGEHRLPNNSNGPKNPKDPSIETTYEPLVNISSSNVVLEGFIVHRSKGRGIRIWNSSQTISNISIINNKISKSYMSGIMMVGENTNTRLQNISIVNNEIYQTCYFAPFVRSSSVVDWPGAMSIKWGDNITIENNYIHQIWGEGILVDSNLGNDRNITIKNNKMHDIMRPSIYIHGNVNTFEITNNHIYSTNTEPNGPGDWNAGLVVVDTEPQYTDRGHPKHSPTDGILRNNKVEIDNYIEGGTNITAQNNNSNINLVQPVGLIQGNPTPIQPTPTDLPTPSINPKYDLDENGVVDIMDIVDLVKYLFR